MSWSANCLRKEYLERRAVSASCPMGEEGGSGHPHSCGTALMYVTVASASIRVHLLLKLSSRDHC